MSPDNLAVVAQKTRIWQTSKGNKLQKVILSDGKELSSSSSVFFPKTLHTEVNKKLVLYFTVDIKSVKIAVYESQYFKIITVAEDCL